MPKKIGTNSKAEAARERKTAIEAEKKEKEAREKEEHFWREAEGAKSRAARKKEEEAEKRAEASARRAENRRLAEAEQRQLEIESRKPDKKAARVSLVPVPKVTGADLERRRRWRGFRGRRRRRKSRVAEEEYERTVLVANTNRNEAVVEAHSVEEALAKMNVSDALPPDRHPERRLKASFKEFNIGFRNSNISR
ncbi:hypothetical protein QJS10_CPA01g00310 [Acorus calamus]|uniref:Coiled-coil domain-containing protein n=1 Tax=Acorus calamus TaxID=4465 RepID=A0AAV9FH96_ACOCL|nr:hypothetical protein QJS10_CPA01g00310 [Acorus calamus]